MNNDWTDILRDKLAGHEIAPPADLWTGIDAALGEAATRKRRIWPWISAAACIAVLLGFFFLPKEEPRPGSAQKELAAVAGKRTEHREPAETVEAAAKAGEPGQKSVPSSGVSRPGKKSIPLSATASPGTNSQPAEESRLLAAAPEAEAAAQAKPEQPEAGKPQQDPEPRKPEPRKKAPQGYQEPPVGSRPRRAGISLNLYAANLSAASAANPSDNHFAGDNFSSAADGPLADDDFGYGTATCSPARVTGKHHRRPLRLGLAAAYPLADRLSLSAGLAFTRLSTEVVYNYRDKTDCRQTNIGLPLAATFRLVERAPVGLYLTAGGMAEFCLSGREDRPQFSVFGGAGIQVSLMKNLSLYAEPLVNHYIDNGSGAVNIYKDKPTDFDLRVGLRLALDRPWPRAMR